MESPTFMECTSLLKNVIREGTLLLTKCILFSNQVTQQEFGILPPESILLSRFFICSRIIVVVVVVAIVEGKTEFLFIQLLKYVIHGIEHFAVCIKKQLRTISFNNYFFLQRISRFVIELRDNNKYICFQSNTICCSV